MADFLHALGCFLLACVAGMIVLFFGTDDLRVDSRDDANLLVLAYFYGWMLVFASPFWLFTFLPLYLGVASKSFIWHWYVAPLLSALIGFIGSLIVFGVQDFYYPRDLFFPTVIGFSVFLFGAILKRHSNTRSIA